MALYGFSCPACGSTEERFISAAERDHTRVLCRFCQSLNYATPMQRIALNVPAIRGATVSRP